MSMTQAPNHYDPAVHASPPHTLLCDSPAIFKAYATWHAAQMQEARKDRTEAIYPHTREGVHFANVGFPTRERTCEAGTGFKYTEPKGRPL